MLVVMLCVMDRQQMGGERSVVLLRVVLDAVLMESEVNALPADLNQAPEQQEPEGIALGSSPTALR